MVPDTRGELGRGLRLTGWTITDLWLASVALGCNASQTQIRAAIEDQAQLARAEYNLLALALNESLDTGSGLIRYLGCSPFPVDMAEAGIEQLRDGNTPPGAPPH